MLSEHLTIIRYCSFSGQYLLQFLGGYIDTEVSLVCNGYLSTLFGYDDDERIRFEGHP